MSDSFCILPYNHVSIDPTGQIRPCCNYNYQHKDFSMGDKFPNILDIQDPNNLNYPIGFFAGFVSVILNTGIYALELIVSLVQAYVFTLLSCVFIGMAIHADH